ncbi:hypothetical protein [Halorussus litoreus]|uniref:hypothetical protein n=1 Tax=Halorussus litoreus TaxID=1710536 RepID=UPI000E24786E|nr:hypothetical protein [Halorussus litoreus]
MSTDDVAGPTGRLDRWLDEYAAGLLERKRRLEASYYETRASRAERRSDLDAAQAYYDRARSLRGTLGDREAAIELGTKQAAVARANGDFGTAREQFQRVVELHARREDAAGALDALEPLLEILESQGDDDALRQWWGHAMMVLGKAEAGEIPQERRDALVDRYAEQIRSEDSAGRLYGFALDRLLTGEDDRGVALLDATWDRREVVREQVGAFRVVLAAGVARVAHAEAGDGEVSSNGSMAGDLDREATLDFVADHCERLSDAATALFERLPEGETDVDPAALRSDVDSDDEVELRDVEAEVFGRLLDDLD